MKFTSIYYQSENDIALEFILSRILIQMFIYFVILRKVDMWGNNTSRGSLSTSGGGFYYINKQRDYFSCHLWLVDHCQCNRVRRNRVHKQYVLSFLLFSYQINHFFNNLETTANVCSWFLLKARGQKIDKTKKKQKSDADRQNKILNHTVICNLQK